MTSMLSVIIPRDLIIAPVSLDTLEMEVIALVISCSYSLFVYSICMIEVYSRFVIVMKMKSFVCRPSVSIFVKMIVKCFNFSHIGSFPS